MPNNAAPFVRKTYEIVSDPATDSVVCWSPKGTSFYIVKEHSFQKEVLPKYFKHDNLCSFIRQLNTYGFRKVSGSKDFNSEHNNTILEFEQQDFQRDHPEMLIKLKRKTNKKTTKEESTSPQVVVGGGGGVGISNSEDINTIVSDRAKMASALSTLIKQQQETEKTLKALWSELAEAKKVVAALESRKRRRTDNSGSTSPSTPPQKRLKTEFDSLACVPPANINPLDQNTILPVSQNHNHQDQQKTERLPDWLSSDNESESDVTSAARNMAELSSHMSYIRAPPPTN